MSSAADKNRITLGGWSNPLVTYWSVDVEKYKGGPTTAALRCIESWVGWVRFEGFPWRPDGMETHSVLLAFCDENPLVDFPNKG